MLEDLDVRIGREAQTGEGGEIGTFDLCARCPSHSNCCSRVRHGGEIEAPLLRGHEVRAIERETGESANAFSEQRLQTDSIRWMRTGDGGCYFFRNGKCSIYAIRPIDCRLFPYDVRENEEGQLVLIAYTSLCPETFDVARYRAHALSLLDLLGDDILTYGQVLMPGMDAKPHVTLGTIDEIRKGGRQHEAKSVMRMSMNTTLSGSGRVDSTKGLPNGEFRGQTKLVKITEDVRKFAAEQKISEEEALRVGLEQKATEFNEAGAEIYAKV